MTNPQVPGAATTSESAVSAGTAATAATVAPSPERSPILFLGLGKMGLPMARHLQAAGHPVTGWDLSPARRALAAQAGLALATSPEAALPGFTG